MSGRIMVDELKAWGTATKGQAGRVFGAGKMSCHLMTDGDDIEALHAFAAKIGMRREWFQPLSSPHYDLTPGRRAAALLVGAVFVPAMEQARARVAKRALKGAPSHEQPADAMTRALLALRRGNPGAAEVVLVEVLRKLTPSEDDGQSEIERLKAVRDAAWSKYIDADVAWRRACPS